MCLCTAVRRLCKVFLERLCRSGGARAPHRPTAAADDCFLEAPLSLGNGVYGYYFILAIKKHVDKLRRKNGRSGALASSFNTLRMCAHALLGLCHSCTARKRAAEPDGGNGRGGRRAAEGLTMRARDAWLIGAVKGAKKGAQISLMKGPRREQ